ncbi:Nif3-like dinuclear metal center hexameric protein, partial [Pseudomonas syringae pv. tagetis]|uniref:Nif3-like dinuclear metal center hexameric protein n=1 Tax=Pseudomonas syringae group genomosp. 7 TaxID=251699 RepID=UPI00376FF384
SEHLRARVFARRVQVALGRVALHVEGSEMIRRVGWCSGGGQNYFDQAVLECVYLFLSGDASEQTLHSARENDISFIAAGH